MSFTTETFKQDTYHFFGDEKLNVKALLRDAGYRYVFYLRMVQAGGWRKALFFFPRKHLSLAHGLEISPEVRAGGGSILGIPTVLPSAALPPWGAT